MFPREWSEEFIDAPVLKHQRQPSTDREGMEAILIRVPRLFTALLERFDACVRRYTKLLKDREFRLQWAEKIGTGFTLPKPSSGLRGLLIPFRKVG